MAYTYHNPHRQALLAIDQELTQRRQEFEFLKARIANLEEARKSIFPLAQQEADQEMTATLPALCLRVLSFTPGYGVSVPKIREGLKLMGVEVAGKNPLAVLHTTLGRPVSSGFAIPTPNSPQGTTYFEITLAGQSYLQQVF